MEETKEEHLAELLQTLDDYLCLLDDAEGYVSNARTNLEDFCEENDMEVPKGYED